MTIIQTLLNNREIYRNFLFPGRKNDSPIRLSLGSGGKPTPSYRNTDIFASPNIEEVFSQSDIPYPDASVHALHSEHALEHSAGHTVAEKTIAEWARVLRHGGDLNLEVPDLEECCRQFLLAEDREALPGERFGPRDWFKYTIYGIQDITDDKHPDGQYHRTGFTCASIRRILEKYGFIIRSLETSNKYGTPSIEIRATQIKQPLKVFWLIPGQIDESHGSLRIRRLNIHKWLKSNGVDSRIIEEYDKKEFNILKEADVAIFVSFGQQESSIINRLRKCGISVIIDHCEDISGLPYQKECYEQASILTCCSTILAEKSTNYGRTLCIPDAYEIAEPKNNYINTSKLKIISCCMGGNQAEAESIKPIIEELGMELVTISEWPQHNIRWEKETWLQELTKADIVMCIQKHWLQPAKSNNRVTQAMSLGLPVCASPLQSYKEAIIHGENGYICSSPQEWKECLESLKDYKLRERIGQAAKKSINNYAINTVGKKWLDLLETLAIENCTTITDISIIKNKPPVDIIIATWNNLPLLQECINSIRQNTDWPHNIIVVNSGTDATGDWLNKQPDIKSINSTNRLHFSSANNIGIKASNSEYVVLLNDDTIVTKNWLDAMMQEGMKQGIGAVNGFSNCDLGWLHNEMINVGGVNLVPSMTLEQIKPIIPQLYNTTHNKVVTDREWVAFFATLIPRKVINEIGELDENFKSGCEDLDWCIRAKKHGYKFITTYDAFIFHFGGATRKRSESINHHLHHEEDKLNHAYLKSKLEKQTQIEVKSKKKIGIWTGPAWEPWNIDTPKTTGIGGSETVAGNLAIEFVKLGHNVKMFGQHQNQIQYGVQLMPWETFNQNEELDLLIISRNLQPINDNLKAKKVVAWFHDIFSLSNIAPNNHMTEIQLRKIDKFITLSPWHADFFLQYHQNIPKDKIIIIPNGFDLARYDNNNTTKIKGRMIYSSSPDRGLDVLLDCMPKIRKQVPEAHLKVFYGFTTWEACIKQRGNKQEIAWMEQIKRQLKQPGVEYFGRINQIQLAEEFKQAELWGFPSHFTETHCVTANESQAAGTPVITTNLAALSTTVGDSGIILDGDSRSEAYQSNFISACTQILTNKLLWDEYSKRGLQKVKQYDWCNIIKEWVKLL